MTVVKRRPAIWWFVKAKLEGNLNEEFVVQSQGCPFLCLQGHRQRHDSRYQGWDLRTRSVGYRSQMINDRDWSDLWTSILSKVWTGFCLNDNQTPYKLHRLLSLKIQRTFVLEVKRPKRKTYHLLSSIDKVNNTCFEISTLIGVRSNIWW